jgi:hypothetical protein
VKALLDDPVRRPRPGGLGRGRHRDRRHARGMDHRRGPPRVSVRRRLGPSLANAGVAWAVFAAVLLLVIWALPLPPLPDRRDPRRPRLHRLRARSGGRPCASTRPRPRPRAKALALRGATPAQAAAPTQVEELERLAKLRSEELLTEDEYAAARRGGCCRAPAREPPAQSSSASPGGERPAPRRPGRASPPPR